VIRSLLIDLLVICSLVIRLLLIDLLVIR